MAGYGNYNDDSSLLQTLGSPNTEFKQKTGSTIPYPEAVTNDGPYTVFGPLLLPKIYGKDLNAIEIASSGIIALSIYDQEVITINQNDTYLTGQNAITFNATSNADAIHLRSGTDTKKIMLDELMISEDGDFNVFSTNKTAGFRMSDNVHIDNYLSVNGDSDQVGAVQMGSTLSVKAATLLSSTLSVNGTTDQVGSVQMGSTLSVKSATILSSTLSVNDDLFVGGDFELEGNLKVDHIQTTSATNDMVISMGDPGNENTFGTLKIIGNLDVMGTYNQIPIEVDAIHVEDKLITLASQTDNSNQVTYPIDSEATNSKAGIEISGIPNDFNSEHITFSNDQHVNAWEKSIKWNHGTNGMKYLGLQQGFAGVEKTNTESIEGEAFWEFKGGSLRLTGYVPSPGNSGKLDEVSFAMRITKQRDLQFVKIEKNYNENQTVKQVASFGVRFAGGARVTT